MKMQRMRMLSKKTLRNQKGFTLVELAIVLVIIGLILGAVLKGQELINNARTKRLYSQQKEIHASIYTYLDKYGKYPGDDNNANARWGINDGNNNGQVTGFTTNCAAAATTETCTAWRGLRLANLMSGDATSAINPGNPYGGSAAIGSVAVQGLNTHWIGFTNVPYDVCQNLDQQYDDGSPTGGYNTGDIRGSGNYNTATSGVFTLYFRF